MSKDYGDMGPIERAITVMEDIYVSMRTLQDDVMLGQMTRSDIAAWAESDADAIEGALMALGQDVPDMEEEREDEDMEFEETDLGPAGT